MDTYLHPRKPIFLAIALFAALILFGVQGANLSAQVTPAAVDATPEAILTGYTPTALVRNQTHLFVANRGFSPETCQLAPNQQKAVLQRLNFDGTGALTLLMRCTSTIHGIVADDAYVYLRDGDLKIKRISVGGGIVETLVNDVGGCCDLTMDDTHLYWAQRESGTGNNGIFRVAKTGGAVTQIASIPNDNNSYYIRSLAVDGSHVFWVEGRQGIKAIDQPGVGAVGKVAKAGGAVQMLADNTDDIRNPTAIAIDATHVYWNEFETARARRVSKNGGNVTNYNSQPVNLRGIGVAMNDADVYWTDSNLSHAGRLRRAAKAGGDVTDLAIGVLGLGAPLLTDSHVYWPQSGGVYRLPLGTGAVAVDFGIDAVEVTQTIQDLNNSVPLVAEKFAFVRVYPRVDINTGQNPKVQLRGFRNGQELDWSPLQPINTGVPLHQNGADRFQLDHTFNFKLPGHWRDGSVTLQAEINHDDAIAELNKANNSVTVVANFQNKKPLCVEMVGVKIGAGTATTSDPGFNEIVDWLETAYPVPAVLIDAGGEIKEAGGSYELPDDTNKVLARVGWYRLWHNHNQWQKCGAAHFFGMVRPTNQLGAGGIGYRPGWSSWGVMSTTSFTQPIALNAPWYAPHGGAILAHEIAHNKGRKHVDCGDPDGTDNDYPYSPCNLGSGFVGSHAGFDYFDEAIIGSADAGDLMSYSMSIGKPRWPSDYTYKAIFNKIPEAALGAAATDGLLAEAEYATPGAQSLAHSVLAADDVLLVSALVTPTTNSAVFDQLYVVPKGTITDSTLIETSADTLVSANGAYTLRLLDAADNVLDELKFDLPDSDGPPWINQPGSSFILALPFIEQTASVVLLQNNAQVAVQAASVHTPTVTLLTPNGGESYAGSLTVEWEAKDEDGDPLRFLVQYSPDNGATWQVVETETFSATLVLTDVSHLPGTDGFSGLVRVFANDGLRTASDVSDRPFSLRGQKPQASISNPKDGEIVAFGERLVFVGDAFDAEDGRVDAAGLSWLVDGAAAGSGREIEVTNLALGKHTVQLTAKDSDDMVDTVEHSFIVQKQYCDANDNRLDLVFVVDNSAPMTSHADTFCKALPGILSDLADLGLTVRHQVFDTADARSGGVASACATAVVQNQWTTEIDHPADWGKAVATLSANYAWQDGYTRLIVPVTNQGAEDGNPTADPGADRDAVDAAIVAANAAAVAVSPLMMPPADSMNFFANIALAEALADATGGVLMQWTDAELNVAQTIQDAQAKLGCAPDVDSFTPSIAVAGQDVCALGRNIWPGTAVSVGGRRAPSATAGADGVLFCFEIPFDLEPGAHAIDIERPGARPNRGTASVEIVPVQMRVNLFLPMLNR